MSVSLLDVPGGVITNRREVVVVADGVVGKRQGGGWWTGGGVAIVLCKTQGRLLVLRAARARARMSLDHTLGGQKDLNLLAELSNIATFSQPFRALRAETKAFKSETNAGQTAP